MRTILCYGDSNTHGYNPIDGTRFPRGVRWTSVLQEELPLDYVVEEGCNGRTTFFEDPNECWKNGLTYLKPCLNSHKPIDIVVLMLGTNDQKKCFNANANMSAEGVDKIIKTIIEFTKDKQGFAPRIILVSPIHIGSKIESSPFRVQFSRDAVKESKKFARLYKKVSKNNACEFLDAAKYAKPSCVDCLHMMSDDHHRLGKALAKAINNLK